MAPPFDLFKKVSQAPTNPQPAATRKPFDVAELYSGPAASAQADTAATVAPDEKLRQADFWVIKAAIISPYYDIEYNDGPPQTFTFGDQKSRLVLPSDQSYSSFVLMPLLNLVL